MKSYKITLGNPCTYGWQNMTPTEKGRHCLQCDKIVVDFTIMSDEQVIQYLLTHKNACGHFNKSQLGRSILLHEPKKRKHIHWPAIAAMLVAGLFQVIPSNLNAQMQTTTGAKISVNANNENKTSTDKDSLITMKIKVVDSKTKKAIVNANIQVGSIGEYITDKKGYFSFSTNYKDLPENISVVGYANDYYQLKLEIDVKEFTKKPYYQLEMWYNDINTQVDGGMIHIEQE